MAMEDEDELLSVSDPSDSSEEFFADSREEEDIDEDLDDVVSENNQPSTERQGRPPDEDRKSKNVDALLRYY